MKTKKLLFLSICLLLMTMQTSASGQVIYEPSISVNISKAYYEDVDKNGINDVIVHTQFQIQGFPINNINYLITLTLPSGRSFSYIVVVLTSNYELTLENLFYDHALEAGWYTVSVYVKLSGFYNIADSDQVIFDPPGGDSADPGGMSVRAI